MANKEEGFDLIEKHPEGLFQFAGYITRSGPNPHDALLLHIFWL
jgi:hypothetical protein